MNLIRLEANLRFQVALIAFSTVASNQSLISDFVACWKFIISQNHGLQRADNGLKSKNLNHKLTFETCETL